MGPAGVGLPDARCPIVARSHDPTTVGAERSAGHHSDVPGRDDHVSVLYRLPDDDCAIATRRHDRVAQRAEGEVDNGSGLVKRQFEATVAPGARRRVRAPGDDHAAVGTEGGRRQRIRVPDERVEERTRGPIPDAGGLVGAGGDDLRAVGAEGCADDAAGMPRERWARRAGRSVPEVRRLIGGHGEDAAAVGAEGRDTSRRPSAGERAEGARPRPARSGRCDPDSR